MRFKSSLGLIVAATLIACLTSMPAASQSEDRVFGRELMTQQELQQHNRTMRSLNSDSERAQYRRLHHERMMERARERGVKLKDGMGRGQGMGRKNEQGTGGGGHGKNQQ